jgi:hypothetical protein
VSWGQELKEEINNLEVIELEAMYDKYRLSTRKQVEFFGEILSRIQGELEKRNLSEISTEKLFATYECPLIAVENVSWERVPQYGIIKGEKVTDSFYHVSDLVEKPKPLEAPSHMGIVGRYLMTPDLFA